MRCSTPRTLTPITLVNLDTNNMGYKTDEQRRRELAFDAAKDIGGITNFGKTETLNEITQAMFQLQAEAGEEMIAYIIEEYHEPTNQRRRGHWLEVMRIKFR